MQWGQHYRELVATWKFPIYIGTRRKINALDGVHSVNGPERTASDALLTNVMAIFHCEMLVHEKSSARMSEMMQAVLNIIRVHSNMGIAYYYTTNGICEQYMRTIEKTLKS